MNALIEECHAVNRGDRGHQRGEFSELVIEELSRRFLRGGDTAIDCGVADGRFFFLFQQLVGPRGFVIGFEAIPEVARKLRRGGAPRRTAVIDAAVAEESSGPRPFFWAKDCRWKSSLVPHGLEAHDVEEIMVDTTTIDETIEALWAVLGPGPVSLMKLDIEGAEFPALRGAAETLRTMRPVVLFENGLHTPAGRFGYSADDFFQFFDNHGYRLYDVFGVPVEPRHWRGSVGLEIAWNFLAVHRNDRRHHIFLEEITDLLQASLKRIKGESRNRGRKASEGTNAR